jgi:hypothetical protein
MTYDLADRLTGIDAAGTANDATFTLDALGRFRTRVLSGSTDTYSYAGRAETVVRISTSSGPTVTDSIVSPTGDRLGIRQGSTLNWLVADPHGNTGASLDATEATVVSAIHYDPYGETLGHGLRRRHRGRAGQLDVPGPARRQPSRAGQPALRHERPLL